MNLSSGKKYIFGVSHLPGLLGKEKHCGQEALYEHAKAEAEAITKAGLSGLLLENENDQPYSVLATAPQVASMTDVANKLRITFPDLSLGVEFLINDPQASLTVAKASGFDFIRTDYWVDKMHRPEYGNLEVDTIEFNKFKKKIGAENVQVFADIQVKYATMREKKTLTQSTLEAFEQGAAAVVVSGNATGEPINFKELEEVRKAAGKRIVLIGSGFSYKNAKEILTLADGALVGTSLMENSIITYEKAAQLAEVVYG